MRKLLSAALLGALILVTAGCGNSGEKDKNKDKDVPKQGKAE